VSESPPEPPTQPERPVPRHTLDPDRAIAARDEPPDQTPAEQFDTRPYRWMIGIFGLVLVVAFSIYEFSKHGVVSPGVAAGNTLHHFVAPLAVGGPDQPANPRPRCDPAHPNPRALNVCGRTPLALAFFATGSGACKRQVDTLQAVSRHFAPGTIQFAAIAIAAGRSETAKLVRSHHWTIPVAFDSAGSIGALYNVEICPIVELATPGGKVAARLIGEHWLNQRALLARVRTLVAK
jgi:hypothetical protein